MWTLLGKRSAFIGTLGVKYREKTKINNLTTPDPSELHKNLKNLKKNKINNVIIEASSHGLSQYRLDGINFSISALSSFSRDPREEGSVPSILRELIENANNGKPAHIRAKMNSLVDPNIIKESLKHLMKKTLRLKIPFLYH